VSHLIFEDETMYKIVIFKSEGISGLRKRRKTAGTPRASTLSLLD
jgi:hypothetical protein